MPEEARISANEPARPVVRYLPTEAAAAYLGLSCRTLEKWRLTGDGPPFSQLGKAVRYDVVELDRWMAVRRRTSTSDAPR